MRFYQLYFISLKICSLIFSSRHCRGISTHHYVFILQLILCILMFILLIIFLFFVSTIVLLLFVAAYQPCAYTCNTIEPPYILFAYLILNAINESSQFFTILFGRMRGGGSAAAGAAATFCLERCCCGDRRRCRCCLVFCESNIVVSSMTRAVAQFFC